MRNENSLEASPAVGQAVFYLLPCVELLGCWATSFQADLKALSGQRPCVKKAQPRYPPRVKHSTGVRLALSIRCSRGLNSLPHVARLHTDKYEGSQGW